MDSTYGIISLLPVLVTIVTAIITKRAVEPLICGALVGYIILDKQHFVVAYLDSLYGELGESAYFVVIFGLFGSLSTCWRKPMPRQVSLDSA